MTIANWHTFMPPALFCTCESCLYSFIRERASGLLTFSRLFVYSVGQCTVTLSMQEMSLILLVRGVANELPCEH